MGSITKMKKVLICWRPSAGRVPQLMAAMNALVAWQGALRVGGAVELYMAPGNLKALMFVAEDGAEDEVRSILDSVAVFIGQPTTWDVVGDDATLMIA